MHAFDAPPRPFAWVWKCQRDHRGSALTLVWQRNHEGDRRALATGYLGVWYSSSVHQDIMAGLMLRLGGL